MADCPGMIYTALARGMLRAANDKPSREEGRQGALVIFFGPQPADASKARTVSGRNSEEDISVRVRHADDLAAGNCARSGAHFIGDERVVASANDIKGKANLCRRDRNWDMARGTRRRAIEHGRSQLKAHARIA